MTSRRALALTCFSSLALVTVIALPVLRNPEAQLFGLELVGRHHDPFTVMEQYAAGHVPAPYLQPVTDLPGMALSRVMPPVAAYNALVLMTFPLTAIAAYAHARYVIGSSGGAFVSALLFAFSPFHLAHAAYHIHIAQTQWIPLFLLSLWRLLDRPTAARAAVVTGALLVVGGASFYLGFIAAATAAAAAVAYLSVGTSGAARTRATLAWTVAAVATAAVIALLAVGIWFPELLRTPATFGFPAQALDQHSAKWWSYVLPPAGHPWLGARAADLWRAGGIDVGLLEQQVSLGVSVLGLAAVAVIAGVSRNDSTVIPARVLLVTAIAAFFFSLPPVMAFGAWSWPMPSAVLHSAVPLFRAYARFGVIVSLVVTTLAGAGVTILMASRFKAHKAIALGFLLLAVVEYWPGVPSRDVLPTSAHRWLATVDGVRLFDCVTPTPGATGAVAALMRREVMFPAGPFADCAEPQFTAKLAAFDFTHLLIRRDSPAGARLFERDTIDGARLVRKDTHTSVLEVVASKPPAYTMELSGFHPRAFLGRDSWRWMGREGSMTIINTARTAVIGDIDLEMDAFQERRRVRVMLDDQVVATLIVDPDRAWHRVGPLKLGSGTHVIHFVSDTTSIPAAIDPVSVDRRALSVRLREWRWRWLILPS